MPKPFIHAQITGDKELDRRLATFEKRTQRKFLRQALNDAIKFVERRYKAIVAVRTGAMRDAAVRRTPKGQRRGVIARVLIITRASLARAIQQARIREVRKLFKGRHGVKDQRQAAVEQVKREHVTIGRDGFYPKYVELGASGTPAQRPLRAAIYGAEQAIRQGFVKQLRAAVSEAGSRSRSGVGR